MNDPDLSKDADAEGSYAAGDVEIGEEPAPIREWIDAIQGVVQHNAETRPYTTLLVAGAVGWVLAAGIPPMVSKAAFNAGGRLVMAKLVQSLLSDQL